MTTAQPTQVVRTLVVAKGVHLDDQVSYALTQLRERQEARLVAQQQTAMSLRHATRVAPRHGRIDLHAARHRHLAPVRPRPLARGRAVWRRAGADRRTTIG